MLGYCSQGTRPADSQLRRPAGKVPPPPPSCSFKSSAIPALLGSAHVCLTDSNLCLPVSFSTLSAVLDISIFLTSRDIVIFLTFRELVLPKSWCRYMTMGNVKRDVGLMNQPLYRNSRAYPQVPYANSLNTKLSVGRIPVSGR
jgi:hypothetical protein